MLDPSFIDAYAERAVTNALLGNLAEARQNVDRAVELGADRVALEGILQEIQSEQQSRP